MLLKLGENKKRLNEQTAQFEVQFLKKQGANRTCLLSIVIIPLERMKVIKYFGAKTRGKQMMNSLIKTWAG